MANEKGLPLPRMERGIVARGRTIEVPDVSQSITVGFHEHGKPVKRAGRKLFGPNQEIELPAEEIAALRAHGFVTDPNRIEPPHGNGPSFKETGAAPAAA